MVDPGREDRVIRTRVDQQLPWFQVPDIELRRDLSPQQEREIIEAAYEPFLDGWYASGQKVIWQE